MKIDVITIFPEMFDSIFSYGVIGKAIEDTIVDLKIHDLRKWSINEAKQVDDRPYGGGPGMVLRPEPIFDAVEELKSNDTKVIFLTPKGQTLKQEISEELSKVKHLIIICGRYEGVDQRVIDKLVDINVSIGDYVLSGGEIPAMVLVDSIGRLIPGVIKNDEFNDSESFSNTENRKKLDFPQYTRPEEFKGIKVPKVLLSGDHKKIKEWRNSKQNTK